MTSCNQNQSPAYFDAQELAELLNLSTRTVVLRAKRRPWLLPPRAQLYDRELLRWRQDVIMSWLAETAFEIQAAASSTTAGP